MKQLFTLYRKLLRLSGDTLLKDDCRRLRQRLGHAWQVNPTPRDVFGLNPLIKDMQTAVIVAEEIGMRRASILGVMLHDTVRTGTYTAEEIGREFGEDVAGIIRASACRNSTKRAPASSRRTSASSSSPLPKTCASSSS